jgi:predicted porin
LNIDRTLRLSAAAGLLGAAAAAQAQSPAPATSNVTLYGVLDMALEWADAGLGSVQNVQSGGMMGSRWGLRGTEDLGGGLKTVFVIESGFGADTGTLQQGGRAFGRQALVGLDGPWGTVTLGRQYSPQYWAFSRTDAFELGLSGGHPVITRTRNTGTPATPTPAGILTSYVTTGRSDNALVYTSPAMSGLQVRLLAATGEQPGGDRRGFAWGASAHYSSGPLDANIGYTTRRDNDGFGDLKVLSVGGSYTLGKARIYVGHTIDANTTASTAATSAPKTEYALTNLGVRYSLTDLTTLIAQYTRVADDSEGLTANRDGNLLAAGVVHHLSKRTAVYGSVGAITNQNGSNYSLGGGLWVGTPAAGDETAKSIMVGIRHLF